MSSFSRSRRIALIHGWDPALYNGALPPESLRDALIGWRKSPDFIELLSRIGDLCFCDLPGFCGISEPTGTPFEVRDFADYVYRWNERNGTPEVLLGFSFGAAVALHYKAQYGSATRLVLVSPAIKRRETIKSQIAHVARYFVPPVFRNTLKGWYQGTASKYYRLGTPFLRSTYDKIARQDLTEMIDAIRPGEVLFIFGDQDTEAPWNLVKERIVSRGHKYHIIDNAGHAVIRTHPREVTEAIAVFLTQGR